MSTEVFESKSVIKLNSKTVIKKSAELAQAPMKLVELNRGLDLRQQRFFNMAILTVDETGKSEFGKDEFEEIFKGDYDNFYSKTIKNDIYALGSLGMLESTNEIERWRSVFIEVLYDKTEYKYQFIWSPLMLEHVKNVKKTYIQQDLSILARFNNKYSFIWYDFFKSNYRKWKWTISKEEIMAQLRVEDKKTYIRNHAVFYKQCIEMPLKEVNEFTEYEIECEVIRKNGSRVIGYNFIRKTKSEIKLTVTPKQIETLTEIVDRYSDSNLIFQDIANIATIDSTAVPFLTGLLFELQTFKRFLIDSESFTSDAYKDIVAMAIQKDNAFKKKIKELKEIKASNPTIFDFLPPEDQEESKPKSQFYNWLEERE